MFDKYDVARFWSKVDVQPLAHKCWEWRAGLFDNGYGQFKVDGQSTQAHRFAFAYFNGGGLEAWAHICHQCDNRKCCNPRHLFGGSARDNVYDAMGKGRRDEAVKGKRGERCNFAKLTADKVRDIRAEYAKGHATYRIIANRYGVTEGLIGQIVKRKVWNHIA
jgi:hypothetical protein